MRMTVGMRAIYFNEESKNAGKNIPRSMFIAVGLVAAIYLLINIALINIMPMSQLAASELPVAAAADIIFGPNGKFVITILAVITLLSILNSNLLIGPRILFAMSRDGLFAAKCAKVNSGGTPWFSLLLTIGAALPLIFLGSFETLLAITAFLIYPPLRIRLCLVVDTAKERTAKGQAVQGTGLSVDNDHSSARIFCVPSGSCRCGYDKRLVRTLPDPTQLPRISGHQMVKAEDALKIGCLLCDCRCSRTEAL